MSGAFKCDRCEDFFEKPTKYNSKIDCLVIGHKAVSQLVDHTTVWYDLCPKCVEELTEWLKKPTGEDKWTDEDCDAIGCWECKYFRQDKNVHNPYDEKGAYYCGHKKLYISGNVSRPDYMDMRYTDFDKLGCKEEK